MSSVAAKARAAGRRRGSGMRPLMGWGGGSASVEAVSVIATGDSWVAELGGAPALGAGRAALRSSAPRPAGAAAGVPEPLVARWAAMPAGWATVGSAAASGDVIGACGVGAAPWAGFTAAAPAIAGTGGGKGDAPLRGAGAPERMSANGGLPAPPALPESASGGAEVGCAASCADDCAAGCATSGGGGLAASGDAGGGLVASVRAKCWKVGALGRAT